MCRMREILDRLNLKLQGAFLLSWSTRDIFLLAHEMAKNGSLDLNIDLSKAYDLADRTFLRSALLQVMMKVSLGRFC